MISRTTAHHRVPSPPTSMQNASGEKRKSSQLSILDEQMKKQEAIALTVQNIKSFKELGLDISKLEHDLQLLMGQQDAPGGAADGSLAVKRRKGTAETEAQVLAKLKASWEPGEIVGLMVEHVGATGVQEAGCKALWYLGFNDANMDTAEEGGAFEAVVAGMSKHVFAEEVQEQGSRALAAIATHARFKTAEEIAEMTMLGGIDTVVAGMRAHAGAAGVQAQGCNALGTLLESVVCGQNVEDEESLTEAIVAGMREHAGAAGVQVAGLRALSYLIMSVVDSADKVVELNVIEAVLAAMSAHVREAAVQVAGCEALEMFYPDYDKIARLGGIEVVVAGMRAHEADAGVQFSGLRALSYFGLNAGNVSRMKELSTVRGAVKSTIAAHPSSRVQQLGEQVLKKLW